MMAGVTGICQKAHLNIGAYSGANYSIISTNEPVNNRAKYLGYHVGGFIRVTKPKFFYEVGLNLIRKRQAALFDPQKVEYDYKPVQLNFFEIPLLIGYKPVHNPAFKWRLYTGINSTFNGGRIENDPLGFGPDEYKSPNVGWRLGTGFDVAFISIDINSTLSLGQVFNTPVSSQMGFLKFDLGFIL
jgi:outer membrane protein with beta-barrel domain